jgi:hypothetical protein
MPQLHIAIHLKCTDISGLIEIYRVGLKEGHVLTTKWYKINGTTVELSLSYGQRSVQFVLVSDSPLGPLTRFYPYPFFSNNCFVVIPVGRPL